MQLKESKIDGQTIYQCPVFRVSEDRVLLPDGKEVTRNRVHHNGGSGILPLSKDGEILLVEQYRYGIGSCTLEIPAGKLEVGEQPTECAKRELREEVGAVTEKITFLGEIAVSPAYDSEIIYIFLAEDCSFVAPQPDEDEFLKVHRLPLIKAYEMVLSGEITDAKTQIAILKVMAQKE